MKYISLLVALAVVMSTYVQAEEPSNKWAFQTAKANEAVRKYQAARKKLADTFEKTRRENLASLIEKLQEQVKAATTSNNLDEALAIRDAIKTLQAESSVPAASEETVQAHTIVEKKGSKDKSDELRPVFLISFNFRTRMLGDDMRLTTDKSHGAFFIRPGLSSGARTFSLESARIPGAYLVVPKGIDQRGLNPLALEKIGEDANQKRRATFKMRPGIADKSCVSFESFSKPGFFIRHRDFGFQVAPLGNTVEDRECETYKIVEISEE